MANLFDRLIGVFNPVAGLRRHTARELLQRAYEGASRRDGWKPKRAGASANTDHAMDANELRVRARALVQNVPYIARGLGSLVANVIGTGIVPRSLNQQAAKIDAIWDEWAKVADADGRLDLYGLQAAAYRAMEQDGEVLIRLRTAGGAVLTASVTRECADLLALRPGDVIPISLPQHIPLTVAGRLFAHGTLGEADGRAAIRISRIEPHLLPPEQSGNFPHE